jgi:anti-sigma regulatory factor (Ser/Thr protein kinase)
LEVEAFPNMQPTAEKTWQIPNRMEALATLAKEVYDWLAALPLSSRAKYSSGLAIEEMVTNVIKYAYADNRKHLIHIQVSVTRDHVTLVFEDDGRPFDPTKYPPTDIDHLVESRQVGGLGIELVRRMCEKMSYARVGNLNRVTLQIRRLQPDDTQFISLSAQ